jgi:hypothetical protein
VNEVSTDRPGEYTVDVAHILKTTQAFKYRVHVDETNLKSYAPLILKPAWKPTGDKLGVVVEYSLNPEFSTTPVVLKNLVVVVTYEGAKAAGCQMKPNSGAFLKDKSLVYWKLGDVTLDFKAQKVVARVIGDQGGEPQPGAIEARWEIHGSQAHTIGSGLGLSRLDVDNGKGKEKEEIDPFADESTTLANKEGQWVLVESARKIVSGKYDAKQSA